MPAFTVHIANIAFVAVNTITGKVVSKDDPSQPINAFLTTQHDNRIIPNSAQANTAGWPTLAIYLKSELPYSLVKLNQTTVITSNQGPAMSAVHVAYLQLFNVDPLGNVIDKNNPATTINQMLCTHLDPRVIVDSNIPNSTGNPSVASYIEAEAAAGFAVSHLDQTMIITYSS